MAYSSWEVKVMTITKLKAKNQVTIPSAIIKRLGIKPHEFFAVDIEKNYIKLIPVTVEPRYSRQEIEAIDKLVETQKSQGRAVKPGKQFSEYLKKLAKP